MAASAFFMPTPWAIVAAAALAAAALLFAVFHAFPLRKRLRRHRADWQKGGARLFISPDFTDQIGATYAADMARLLESALGAVNAGLVLFDQEDRVIVANPAAAALDANLDRAVLDGWTFAELTEKAADSGLVKVRNMPTQAWVREMITCHREADRTAEFELADGRWVLLVDRPLGNGWTVGLRLDVTEMKVRENALKLNEERMRDLSRISSDWHWEMDADLRFTYISDRIKDFTGLEPSYFIGKSRRELMSKDSLSHWESHLADLEAHRPFRGFNYDMVTPSGSRRYFMLNGTPIFDDDGKFAGYRGTTTDITNEEVARRAAELAQSRLTDAIEGISAVMLLFDADGKLEMFNSRATYLYGQAGNPIRKGMSNLELLTLVAQSGIVAEAHGREHEWIDNETDRIARADGERVMRHVGDVWLQCRAYRTQDGGILAVETDVTPLIQREQKLRRQSSLLLATMNSMAQGIAAYDSNLKLLSWNRRFLEMSGLEDEVLKVGTPVDVLIRKGGIAENYPDKSIDEVIALRRERLQRADGTPETLAMRNGKTFQLEVHPLDGGGIVTTLADITSAQRNAQALVEAKEEAELANRSKTQFLANITHELRTPLNAIIGFAEVLKDELFGPLGNAQYKDFVVDIHESGRHLLSLINDILDLSRYEIGHRELQAHPMELSEAVHASIRIIRQRAKDKNLTLIDDLPADLPPISAESRAVRQIVINLLSNSIKFTPNGGTITIAAALTDEGGLRFSIADTGIGIAAEDIPRAFAPFEQIDSELSREFEGTGLGLPLVKSLAQLHGADVKLDSEPGRGTTVSVLFPKERVLPKVRAL